MSIIIRYTCTDDSWNIDKGDIMRIKWQDYDDLMPFETILGKIRGKRLKNVTVQFEENAHRLHYTLEADVDDCDIAEALGFRKPPC